MFLVMAESFGVWIAGRPRKPQPRGKRRELVAHSVGISARSGFDAIDMKFLACATDECSASWSEEHGEDPIIPDEGVIDKIIGFARFAYRGPYAGALEPRHPSVRAMMTWHMANGACLVDLRKFEVLESFRLRRPRTVISKGHGLDSPNSTMFELHDVFMQSLLDTELMGTADTVRGVLLRLGMPAHPTTMQLPAPIAVLLVAGSWPFVMLDRNSRWAIESDAQFAQRWITWREEVDIPASRLPPAASLHEKDDLFSATLFQNLSDELRGWATSILAQHEGDAADVERLLTTFVSWLDRCAVTLTGDTWQDFGWEATGNGGYVNNAGQKGRFRAEFLISCLVFTFNLKSTSAGAPLKRIMRRCFRCTPPELRDGLDRMLAAAELPSPATLVRARFWADVAFMRSMAATHQRIIQGGGILFGLTDSSPQGGRNWLLSEYTFLKPKCFTMAAEAVETMWALEAQWREGEVDVEFEWGMRACRQDISDAFGRHILPPVGLGAMHTDGLHKGHAWLQQHRLESDTWRMTQELIKCYYSMAIDGGPEATIGKIVCRSSQLFPHWQGVNVQPLDDDGLEEDGEPADPEDVEINCHHIMVIPGTYHWVELIQKRLIAQWERFDDIKSLLESACVIFHHQYTRKHFWWSLQGARLPWRQHFLTGPKLYEGGREWGVLVDISAWFRPRRLMIKAHWQVYIRGGDDDDHAGDLHDREKSAHRRRASAAFENDLFWIFISMISIFSGILEHILNYFLSCECHPRDMCEHFGLVGEREVCPMRGRRLADICCGGMQNIIVNLMALSAADLAAEFAGSPVLVVGLGEFQIGKQFVLSEATLRIQPHLALPIRVASMAHRDSRKARAGMAISLALFDLNSPGHEHPSCQELFGSLDARHSVIRVIHGEDWDAHPGLLEKRRKAFFASSTEVAVERDHASMHRNILPATRHSEAYASSLLRRPEILFQVESSEDKLKAYCARLDEVRTPKSVAAVLGLLGHPAIADPDDVDIMEIRSIVYRDDPQTQYAALPSFLVPHPPPPPPPPAAPPWPPPPPDGHDPAGHFPGPDDLGPGGPPAPPREPGQDDDDDLFGCGFFSEGHEDAGPAAPAASGSAGGGGGDASAGGGGCEGSGIDSTATPSAGGEGGNGPAPTARVASSSAMGRRGEQGGEGGG